MEGRYNTRSPAVKRLMREAQELSEPTDQYYAQPLEDNLFEWHFTVRGPADSDFQHGIYHGRIILPVDYPMKPPSIIWLTPNGRFETNKKICLSISGHHPESWQPSWSIRTALLAIIGFMPTRPGGAIGSLEYTPEERKILAKKSQDWKCPVCGPIKGILLERQTGNSVPQPSQEAKDLASQIQFEGEKPKCKDGECPITSAALASQAAPSAVSTATATTPSTSTTASVGSEASPSTQPQQQQPQASNNAIPQWNFPAGIGVPGFPAAMAWPGMPPMSAAMIPRFPLPPSQQPPGCFPMQCFPPGFAPPPQGMSMFPFPPPYQGFPQPVMPGASAPQASSPAPALTTPPDVSAAATQSQSGSVPTATTSAPLCAQPGGRASVDSSASQHLSGGQEMRTEAEAAKLDGIGPVPGVSGGVQSLGLKTKTASGSHAGHDSAGPKINQAACSGSASAVSQTGDGTEQSQPDLLADKDEELRNDVEDNSDSGIPPLDLSETEQRSSYLERSASSSVPDLDKKSKPAAKGLRHRQSATAAVSTPEEGEQGGAEGAGQAAVGSGQRIEAASGDSHPRLVRTHLQPPRAFAEARLAHRIALARSTQLRANTAASEYDGSFFAMLILSVITALILLNRLAGMVDWSLLL